MKRTKKILALSLALVCLVSLTGAAFADFSKATGPLLLSLFGKKDSEEAPAADTPSTTYAASFADVDFSHTDVKYLSLSSPVEEGFYAIASRYLGKEIPEGAFEEFEGQYDKYEQCLLFVTWDGAVTEFAYKQPDFGWEAAEDQYFFECNTWSQGILPLPEGSFAEIAVCNAGWGKDPDVSRSTDAFWEDENYSYAQETYLRILNKDGTERFCTLLPFGVEDYLSSFSVDSEGNILLAAGPKLFGWSAEGEQLWERELDEYVENIVCLPDGRIFLYAWGDGGPTLYPMDKASGEMGSAVKTPNDAYFFSVGGGKYPLYYSNGSNFFGFDPETGEKEKLFSWMNIDVAASMYGDVYVSQDGTVRGLIDAQDQLQLQEDGTPIYQIFTVREVPVDPDRQKTSITLATQWLDYDKRSQLLQFNRNNESYHIDIIDYSEYNTEEDYSAGLTKLQTEIMAGNLPDIIDLNGLPVDRFAAKGLLEDLYPYLDADPELSREDIFPNVLAAYEKDGKLISTVSNFTISSLLGASALVGDTPGWTYQEFTAALSQMPEGCRPLSAYTTRDEILTNCLGLDMDYYVNWKTGECRFDSQEFINLLTFAKQFPERFDWNNYNYETDSDMVGLASGQQMLAQAYIYSIDDVMYNEQYFGQQPYTYIGYPTDSGTGNFFTFSGGLAMSSTCEHKDVVWEFLRNYFTEKYQAAQYSMPSNKKAFEKKLQDAMKIEYRKGTNGEIILDENGEKIPVAKFTIGDNMGNTFEIYALTQTEADKLTELVNTTTRILNSDEAILGIVKEQAEAFFQGQKTAEAVAKLTQSKANIYVNEQR